MRNSRNEQRMVDKIKKQNMKVAFTGTSGSGKTTMVHFVSNNFNLPHLSGSAGDLKTKEDRQFLDNLYHHGTDGGHEAVIKQSVKDPFGYGLFNQRLNQTRRQELIENNHNFVTDRSPLDNLVYCIAQIGFSSQITDTIMDSFADKCLTAWNQLSHVIYIKALTNNQIENNGSRVTNKWYQRASDAQFEYWLKNFFIPNQATSGPKIMVIDYWDMMVRRKNISNFLKNY